MLILLLRINDYKKKNHTSVTRHFKMDDMLVKKQVHLLKIAANVDGILRNFKRKTNKILMKWNN